jgi:hypothetical protein
MRRIENLSGRKFNRLTVLDFVGLDKQRGSVWRCRCDCGNVTVVPRHSLVRRNTTSCGCAKLERVKKMAVEYLTTHGETGSPEYRSWCSMMGRCNNPRNPKFPRYGGRGIKVCERWRAFDNFLKDVGKKPSSAHSIDRKDNDGNYEPKNCQWSLPKTQSRNRSDNHFLEFKGKRATLSEWEEITGIQQTTIRYRVCVGWSTERALTTPVL